MSSRKTNPVVMESNALARARITPSSATVWEERVIATFIARNLARDIDFSEQVFDLRELLGTKSLSTRQYNEAKKAIRAMLRTVVEFPIGYRGISGYPIFASLEINDDGIVKGCLNPKLKPHCLQLQEQFAMRSLPDFQMLSSTYSQRLYRYLNSWHKTNNEKTVGLDELHVFLDTPPALKKDFAQFRIRVLEVAHHEINAVAEKSTEKKPLSFDWEPVRKGIRKVIAVRFVFNTIGRRNAAKIAELWEAAKAKVAAAAADGRHVGFDVKE